MKFINELHEGDRVNGIYLCKHKQSCQTKNGKTYESILLQDKTGVLDGKIWDPHSHGIDDFDSLDYIDVTGELINFAGTLQLNIKRVRVAYEDEYVEADYLPSSENNTNEMWTELISLIKSVKNPYLNKLLNTIFIEDSNMRHIFSKHSAAKTVHHGFIGGLIEHTLSVAKLCDYMSKTYPLINRDILITSALLHDLGKTRELSPFPINDYTDEGNLLGHIVIGTQIIFEKSAKIEGFPEELKNQVIHCILSHHGELEYGSPKKPATIEAIALSLADNLDARMETISEVLTNDKRKSNWLGFNKILDSNIRRTGDF